ncbi:unnamed protein product, partial [Meganyctiphanes norvegica]
MILSTTIAIIGSSIPMGYGMGVLNSPQAIIRIWIQEAMTKKYDIIMSNRQNVMAWSTVISTFLIGCALGGLKGGTLADKIGRRRAFLINYFLCMTSCGMFTLCIVFQAVEILLTSQFLFGISAGISSVLVPVYLSEIETDSFRGMAVIHAFGISLGMFISQICGMDILLGSAKLWPCLLCIPGLLSLIALLLYPYLQESPVFMAFIHEDTVQRKHLLINNQNDKNLEKECLLSTEFINTHQSEPEKYSIYKLFKEISLHKTIFLTIVLYMNTVFSGINAIVAFGNVIFTSAGLNQQESEIASICATGLRCVMGVVAILLTKKCRRRPVILSALGGCIVSLAMLMSSLCYHSTVATYMAILSCVLYFISYAAGLGALACTISVELLPENPKPYVMSLATGLYWLCNILVGTTFPLIQNTIGVFSLLFFMLYCIVSASILYFHLPETFNKFSITENKNDVPDMIDKSSYLPI